MDAALGAAVLVVGPLLLALYVLAVVEVWCRLGPRYVYAMRRVLWAIVAINDRLDADADERGARMRAGREQRGH